MRFAPLLLALGSCASLSPSVKQELRAGKGFVLVRAPTPMIEVPVMPASELEAFLLFPEGKWQPVNVTSVAGGSDPADVLVVALTRRLNALGYSPTPAARVQVRFEGPPERWPKESGVSAEWILHAQLDDVGLAAHGRPRSLRGSATLFHTDGIERRTTCSVSGEWPRGQVSDSAAWIELLKRCARELLVPFEEVAAQK